MPWCSYDRAGLDYKASAVPIAIYVKLDSITEHDFSVCNLKHVYFQAAERDSSFFYTVKDSAEINKSMAS